MAKAFKDSLAEVYEIKQIEYTISLKKQLIEAYKRRGNEDYEVLLKIQKEYQQLEEDRAKRIKNLKLSLDKQYSKREIDSETKRELLKKIGSDSWDLFTVIENEKQLEQLPVKPKEPKKKKKSE